MATINFLNVGFGDTTIISTNEGIVLIDCFNIENYKHLLPNSKSIVAVFITHQHYDHFTGLQYLKDNKYFIRDLIYSPYERRKDDNSVEYDEWESFKKLATYFDNNGSTTFKPYRQDEFSKPWRTIAGLNFYMIGPNKTIATEDTRELHDASLVITVLSSRRCCFAGDASDKSLNWIAKNTDNYCNDILHASHHGSINGADLDFIKKSNIGYTIISTKSGVKQNVPDSTALLRYKEHSKFKVLRTDLDGTIKWDF
jgi:beta-lactamase superfamily II metal-dependent hydrolase